MATCGKRFLLRDKEVNYIRLNVKVKCLDYRTIKTGLNYGKLKSRNLFVTWNKLVNLESNLKILAGFCTIILS